MKKEDKQVEVEQIIKQLKKRFDNISEIHIAHLPIASSVSELAVKVHTVEADSYEQYLDEFAAGKQAIVDVGEENPLKLPFWVYATYSGPGNKQGVQGTTIYRADKVIGAEPRAVSEGLRCLRKKLSGICPNCGKSVEDIGEHYRERRDCSHNDRL